MLKWVPHDYQKRAIRFLLEHQHGGLLLDPGLGKTSTSLATFQILRQEEMAERALVIAPLRVAHGVWPVEAATWEDFSDLRVQVLHGPKKDELLHEPHDVSVINPEGLEWLLGYTDGEGRRVDGAIDTLDEFPWQVLFLDESSKFKHTDTVRFRTLKPWLSKFDRRVILTGTPAPNGLLDLFGQIYVIDLGGTLSPYITQYRKKYFHPTGYGGHHWVPKKDALRDVQKKIAPLTLRMEAGDYLKLPELVSDIADGRRPRYVELPKDARRAYEQMETLLMAAIDDRLVTAANAAAATGKCRQIANGGLYDDDRAWQHVHRAKVEALEELVDELAGKPALVAYEFKHDLDRLQKAFKDAPHIGGGTTTKEQARITKAWNAGELRVLFAQPQSVAHGLNLQGVGAAAVVWHSIPWDLELYEQFYRRVWRQGQKERVFMYHLVAKGTVDETVLRTLRSKDRTQRALLSALRDYAHAREARLGAPTGIDLRRRKAAPKRRRSA